VSKFLKRVETRRSAAIQWLHENGGGHLVSSIDELLTPLPRDEFVQAFKVGFEEGLHFCLAHPEICALEYSWYYGGSETGEALAYGYDSIKTKGTLDKYDLGPEGLPGVEMKATFGSIIEEYFAAIPTHKAINRYVEAIRPRAQELSSDAVDLTIDLINLWNYQIAIDVFESLIPVDLIEQLTNRQLWVVLRRQGRPAVPVAFIK